MDYAQIHELYHNSMIEMEKARIKSQFEVFNRDFLEDLPQPVREVVLDLMYRFKQEDWFLEAWNKYREHVLNAGLGGSIKMPGYIFNSYLERYVDEHANEIINNRFGTCNECRYSDIDISEYLEHHGIKGQKWGVRRFQNEDGSLTKDGQKRYREDLATREVSKNASSYDKIVKKHEKEYIKKGKVTGARKGSIIGATVGAAGGIGANVINDVIMAKKGAHLKAGSGKAFVARYIKSAVIGGAVGALIGRSIGKHNGKDSAKAHIAERGKEYTDELLKEPINRIKHSDDISEYLEHHGVKGQKWGIRRYQNEDGTLTETGRARYNGKTNISQLTETERNDLYKQAELEEKARSERNKRVMIGAGILTAGAAVVGAAFIASKYSKAKTEVKIYNQQKQAQIAKNASIAAKRRATNLLKIQNGINPGAKTMNFVNNYGTASIGNIIGLGIKHSDDISEYLEHHGIKGQKWGVRRFQNEDGSLTKEGYERYYDHKPDEKKKNRVEATLKEEVKKDKKKTEKNKTSSGGNEPPTNPPSGGNEPPTNPPKNPSGNKVQTTKKVLDNTETILNKTKDIIPDKKGHYVHPDYSHLTNQEMEQYVKRFNIENSYAKAKGESKYVSTGAEKAREILQTTAAGVAIAGSVAALVLTIKQARAMGKGKGA